MSYRRADSAEMVGRIAEQLAVAFGADAVFVDTNSIPPGVDFAEFIGAEVRRCTSMIAVIGPNWLAAVDEQGSPRLASSDDYVRLELEAGFIRMLPVIPVLVSGAEMPSKARLPSTLRELPSRNAATVRADSNFSADMDRLVRAIEDGHTKWLHEPSLETALIFAGEPLSELDGRKLARVLFETRPEVLEAERRRAQLLGVREATVERLQRDARRRSTGDDFAGQEVDGETNGRGTHWLSRPLFGQSKTVWGSVKRFAAILLLFHLASAAMMAFVLVVYLLSR